MVNSGDSTNTRTGTRWWTSGLRPSSSASVPQNAGVVVAFERPLSDRIPPGSVRFVAAAAPVRMPLAGELVREPRFEAFPVTERGLPADCTGVAFDRTVADVTGKGQFAAVPAWILVPLYLSNVAPGLVLDAVRTELSRLLRRIVFEHRPTDFAVRSRLAPGSWDCFPLVGDRFVVATLRAIFFLIIAVEFPHILRTLFGRRSLWTALW